MFKVELGDIKTTPIIRIYKMRLFLASKKEFSDPESKLMVIADMWLESSGFVPLYRLGYKNFFLKSTRIDFDEKKITRADGSLINAQNSEEMVQKAKEAFENWKKKHD